LQKKIAEKYGIEFRPPVFSLPFDGKEDNEEFKIKIDKIISAIREYNQAIQNLATFAINL